MPTDPGSAGFTAKVYGCKAFGEDPWSEQTLLTLKRVAGPLAGDLGLPGPNPLAAAAALVERILGGLGDRAPSIDVFANLLLGQLPQIFLKQFRDIADGTRACYQAVALANYSVTSIASVDLDDRYAITLEPLQSTPVAATLGLAPPTADGSRRPDRDGHDTRAGAGAVASLSDQRPPKKVTIIGGGMGALTAAYFLTDPAAGGEFNVTVYTMGWRLGGKGASGRNQARNDRIEEHGLHIWFGTYHNAIALMQSCYAELGRPAGVPLAAFGDAFKGQSRVVLLEFGSRASGGRGRSIFPKLPGLSGGATVFELLNRADQLDQELCSRGRPARPPRPSRRFHATLARRGPRAACNGLRNARPASDP